MGADQNITDTFYAHRISRIQPAMSWRVQKPGTWIYGFTITWSPGVLALAGDVNELVVYHAHALATFESTLSWLHRIDFDYFMSKTDAKKVFSRQDSIKLIAEYADDQAARDETAPMWRRIFQAFSYLTRAGEEDHLNVEHRARLKLALAEDDEFDGRAIYDLFGDPEFIVTSWTTQHRYQFEAIKAWRRLVEPRFSLRTWVAAALKRSIADVRKAVSV